MKVLNGKELAEFIKERQAKQVRALRQSWKMVPRLVIIQTKDDPVIDQYVRLKQRYGADIGVEVERRQVAQSEVRALIERVNRDEMVQAMIVQLPLDDPAQTDAVLATLAPEKDVDALGAAARFEAATPTAINWLLAGYNVDLANKRLAIVGAGRLVGAPLAAMWRQSALEPRVFAEGDDLGDLVQYDVIVTATGKPGLLKNQHVRSGAVVVDAGTATDGGTVVGDVAAEVRQRHDLTITPIKGGVGPLTVAALFENVITACRRIADQVGQQDLPPSDEPTSARL